MKTMKLAALIATLALLLFAMVPSLSWAADSGADLYKANCAGCHKADASGNPAMKAPALKGVSADKVQSTVATNPKHAAAKKKLNDEQIKAIADYLASLK
jgi:mono/diheme cytochrome c family protein